MNLLHLDLELDMRRVLTPSLEVDGLEYVRLHACIHLEYLGLCFMILDVGRCWKMLEDVGRCWKCSQLGRSRMHSGKLRKRNEFGFEVGQLADDVHFLALTNCSN